MIAIWSRIRKIDPKGDPKAPRAPRDRGEGGPLAEDGFPGAAPSRGRILDSGSKNHETSGMKHEKKHGTKKQETMNKKINEDMYEYKYIYIQIYIYIYE